MMADRLMFVDNPEATVLEVRVCGVRAGAPEALVLVACLWATQGG